MVEKFQEIKVSLGKPSPQILSLLDLYNQMLEYNKKLDGYTVAKCQYERNMETCILEQLYFTNRSKQILSKLKEHKSTCQSDIYDNITDTNALKNQAKQLDGQFQSCYKDGIAQSQQEFEILKNEVQQMIEVSKRELTQ